MRKRGKVSRTARVVAAWAALGGLCAGASANHTEFHNTDNILETAYDQTFPGGWANGVARDGNDNFYVAGSRNGKIWAAKLDDLGQIVWEWPPTGIGGISGVGHDVAVNQHGQVYVLGWDADAGKCLLKKLSPQVGEEIGSWSWQDDGGLCDAAAASASDGPRAGLAVENVGADSFVYVAANRPGGGGVFVVKLDGLNATAGKANVVWQETYANAGLAFQDIAVGGGRVVVIGENAATVHIASRSATMAGASFAGTDLQAQGLDIRGFGQSRKQVLFMAGSALYAGGQYNDGGDGLWLQKFASAGDLSPAGQVFDVKHPAAATGGGRYPHAFDLVNLCAIPWFVAGEDLGGKLWIGGFNTGSGAFIANDAQAESGFTPHAMAASPSGRIVLAGRSGTGIRVVEKVQHGDCSAGPGPAININVAVVIVVATGGGGGGSGGGGADEIPPSPPPPNYLFGGDVDRCEVTVGPNPIDLRKNEFAYITFRLSSPGTLTFSIYDGLGVLVRSTSKEFGAGQHWHYWRGTNQEGRKVSQGLYHLYIRRGQGAGGGGCRIGIGVRN